VEVDFALNLASTPRSTWTDGGLGKLRFDESDDGVGSSRLFAEYRGRIGRTLWGHVVLDYVPDGSPGLDVTEAYLDFKPLPSSRNKQQWRFGAFYPPLSLENGGDGWSSPLTVSYSAVNTWLGEEVRPLGAQWSMRRRLGYAGSPHELGAFAGAFFGNDPAGTLLFWRGWSLHDRQSRLRDELRLPPIALHDESGATVGHVEHRLEPFHEIDGKPGFYAGVRWQFARRAAAQVAYYDNRADPHAFADRQWGWHTNFMHWSGQIRLPWRMGLVTQWLRGETDWIVGAMADGSLMPDSRLVSDELDARFVLLTRPIRDSHAVSLRYDRFDYRRPGERPVLVPDTGDAWTIAYRYRSSPRLTLMLEWLEIESARDLNGILFDAARDARESVLQMRITLSAGSNER